jgi:hypothetical protein
MLRGTRWSRPCCGGRRVRSGDRALEKRIVNADFGGLADLDSEITRFGMPLYSAIPIGVSPLSGPVR